MVDVDNSTCQCQLCSNVGLYKGSDDFFHCRLCDCPYDDADERRETGGGTLYKASHSRRQPEMIKVEPISQYNSYESRFDGTNPSIPEDFGGSKVATFEGYHNEIRLRYVMGLQMMIELQCEALVKEFKVTPLICGLVGPIWLRFVSKTGVFDDDWADKEINDSEMQNEGNNIEFHLCIYLSTFIFKFTYNTHTPMGK